MDHKWNIVMSSCSMKSRCIGLWWGGSFSAILVLTFCVGCGSDRMPVVGDVTFNGEPIKDGTISFEPTDRQGPTTGGKIVNGKYRLVDSAAMLPGKKTVRIFAARKTGRKIPAGSLSQKGELVDEVECYIPVRYNKETTLLCEVDQLRTNQIDFHLKSP